MLNLGRNTRLGVGVEYTDFQLGYQIVDGNVQEYIERKSHANDDYKKLMIEPGLESNENIDSETDFTPLTFEERYYSVVSELFLKIKALYPENIETKVIVKGQEVIRSVGQGKMILEYIESIISHQNIAWAMDGGKPNREDNKELCDDLREELFPEIMKQISLGSRLGQRYRELSEFWGDALSVRFNWAIQYFSKIFKERNYEASLVEEFAPKLIKVIQDKTGKKVTKEETKLIWSLLGLINSGFDPKAPFLNPSFGPDDKESFKDVCRVVGQYLYWSINLKQYTETQSDGQEPLELVQEDDLSGPHYTVDFNEMIMQIQNGTGEIEFDTCFSVFTYEDKETGKDEAIVYRKSSGPEETKLSVKTAVELGDWLVKLYNRDINLHTFRTKFPKNPVANNLNILSYIAYKAGRRYERVKREIEVENVIDGVKVVEIQKVDAKKMSPKLLLDYNEKRVIELFWSLYNSQKEKGIIKPSIKATDMAEYWEA